jgi:uncharacterized protein
MTASACQEVPPRDLGNGIAEFNRHLFFECHETLEALWMAEPRSIRELYQGILQVGVAFYHLEAQRYRPVVTLLERGMAYLQPFSPQCMGIDVARLLADVKRCLTALRALGPEGVQRFDWKLVPKIEMGLERLEATDG